MKPHLIMPMGGAGSRFYKNGFMQPKPLIEINGKPFFYWATESIAHFVEIADITFVILEQHKISFHLDDIILKFYPNANIIVLPKILPGPVFTALTGISGVSDDAPIIINDCDHMFKCDEINSTFNLETFNFDGALLTFISDSPNFSYVIYDDNQRVTGTIEKQVVSNHAICGAYVFKNAQTFKKMALEYIDECQYSECFMSGVYNIMCKHQLRVCDYLLDFHLEFGTPEEYEKAKDSYLFRELL